jgi:hypothetical protein
MPNDAEGLTSQMVDLPSDIFSVSSRMGTGVSESTRGGGCGATTGEEHGLHVAQQVQGSGDQGGALGVAAGSAGSMTGSDNGDADEAAWSGSPAVTGWTQSTC